MSHEKKQIRGMVEGYLRRGYPNVSVDRDGDFVLDHGHIRMFVTLVDWEQGVSMVKIWSLVASHVSFSDSVTQYLNELNRMYSFGTFYWAHDMVYVHQTLLTGGLDPNELLWAVKILAEITDEVDNDVQGRFGGAHYDYSAPPRASYKPWTAEEYHQPRGHGLGTVLVAGAVGVAAGAAIGYAASGGRGYGDYGDYSDSGESVGDIVGDGLMEARIERELAREERRDHDDFDHVGDLGDDEEEDALEDELEDAMDEAEEEDALDEAEEDALDEEEEDALDDAEDEAEEDALDDAEDEAEDDDLSDDSDDSDSDSDSDEGDGGGSSDDDESW